MRKLEVIGLDLAREMFYKPTDYSNIKKIDYDIEIAEIFAHRENKNEPIPKTN